MPPTSRMEKAYVLGAPRNGVNTLIYPTELDKDSYVMLKNVDPFSSVGAFVTRKGTDTFNTTLPVAAAVRGGIRWYASGGFRELIMIASTVIYSKTGAAGNFSSIITGVTADRDWTFASFGDRLYIANGADAPISRNGPAGTFRNAGFTAPTTAPTATAGAAGLLAGTHQYKVSFQYESTNAFESSAGPASNTVVPANQVVDLTGIPLGPSGCTGRVIYRTRDQGLFGTTFHAIASIGNNTATTFTDNIQDGTIGSAAEPFNDNGVPPSGAYFVISWRGRFVYARTSTYPSRIFLSAISSTEFSPGGTETIHGAGVEIFPASHFIDIGDDNSPITGLAIVNDLLVVFKEDQIHTVNGDTADDITVWKSQSAVGCIAQKTIVNMKNGVFFVGRNEGAPAVYAFDGAHSREVSLAIEPTLKSRINGLGDTSSETIQPAATRYRGSYLLSYPLSGGNLMECALLDMRGGQGRWLLMDKIEASCFMPFNGAGDAGELYYGHATESRVLRFDHQETDFHATTPTGVAMTVESGWLDLDYPGQWKQINFIEIHGERGVKTGGAPDPGTTTLTVERRYDFQTSGTNQDCNAVNVGGVMSDRNIFMKRISCQGGSQSVLEAGYLLKLKITSTGPMEIYKVVVYFTVDPPGMDHANNTVDTTLGGGAF